jgi:hypothetical protein
MIAKKETQLAVLTPALAAKFAAMSPLPGERSIKPAHIDFLEKHALQGTFFGPDWAEVKDLSTGRTYRCNGQHSSTMLSRLPEGKFPVGLKATITKYEIDSVNDDGINLFELFDNPHMTRDGVDIMGAGVAGLHELDNIDRKFLIKVANGLAASVRNVNEERQVAYEKLLKKDPNVVPPTFELWHQARQLFNYFFNAENRKFAVWMDSLRNTSIGKQSAENEFVFKCAGVVSVMYADWKKDKQFATTFWTEVITGSGEPDSTSRELARELRKLNTKDKKNQKDFRKVAAKASRNAAIEALQPVAVAQYAPVMNTAPIAELAAA